jgi:elongation factor 1-beta
MVNFPDLNTSEGIKALDEYLLTRSYIDGYQASRDDLAVYSALSSAPSSSHTNALRWYNHIKALLGASFPGAGSGVSIAGQASSAAATTSAKSADGAATKAAPVAAAGDDDSDSDDDDEDLDLFGEMTPEEQAAADEKKKIIEAAKKRGAEKAKLTKSMVVLDVKPWDDETDLAAMEAEVRAVHKDGLLWGKAQLVPIGYGIKKMQITAIIEDAKVPSLDEIIEEELIKEGQPDASETIQSIDIVAFNKL